MDVEEVNTSGPQQCEDNIENVIEICRICLIEGVEMKDLFTENGIASLSVKAMSFTTAKIIPGDGLPGNVCISCAEKLESAYEFKLQVEQADGMLRDRYVSLNNIKEELFFNEVEVDLESDQQSQKHETQLIEGQINIVEDSAEIEVEDGDTEASLLKDHLALLEVKKLAETEEDEEEEEVEEEEEDALEMMETGENFAQVQRQEVEIDLGLMVVQEHGYGAMRKYESEEEANLNVVRETENVKEEEEDDESEEKERQENKNLDEVVNLGEKSMSDKEKNETNIDEQNQIETRKSKRKSARRMAMLDRYSDEENYFENLNLSSRLKNRQPSKSEKVYYMCYICEKQFLAKGVLKEHMHSHEEVRKVMSLVKVPDKIQKTATVSSPTKNSPSGKQPNKCPHCGKEYLYIISYNKHLKQHETEKEESKVEPMPLEVSFHEDENAIDFENYDNSVESDEEFEESIDEYICEKCEITFDDKKLLDKHMIRHEMLKCSVCGCEELDGLESFKNHISQHVAEGVLTEEDLQNDLKRVLRLEESSQADEEEIQLRRKTRRSEGRGLRCPKCPMTYSHKKSLSRHMETHKGTKYSCKSCNQQFTRKDHLRRHMEQHARMKSFKCTQCNKTFGNELTLRNHLIATNHKTIIRGEEYDPNKRLKRVAAKEAQKIIDKIKTEDNADEENDSSDGGEPRPKRNHEKKEYECATCNRKCASKQSLTKHMELHIKDEKGDSKREREMNRGSDDDSDFDGGLDWPMDNHECLTCKKRYSTKKSLLRHQLLHEEPNFECDICNVKFYRKDKLKAHYDKCSEKNPDQVRKCNICGDSFENNEMLKEHRAKHVTEGILTEEDLRDIEPQIEERKPGEKITRKRRTDIVGLECTECNKRYTSRKGLLRHIQVHEGKKYLCDICPKKFYRREHLKIHVAKHNMIKPYKCDRCTKRFAKEEQLINHLSKHDRNFKKNKETDSSKRFLCEICSKSFTQSTTLIAHLRAHNGIKPYVCEVCSRPFTTNAYLKMHMRTHTQERPYICQYCSRAFARADTLANHLTSHTGEAKYHCKYCPKNFRRLKSLKEHVFIHTGQRPYACPTCDRRFNNNGSRYAHSKRCKQNLIQNQTRAQQNTQNQGRILASNQVQTIKPQSVKTITITRQADGVTAQQVMQHQEILMPLILPLTVTLADVGEEVLLPGDTKIYTTS